MSSPQLTGKELRSILNCLNAYGALDPIKHLFDRLSDAQVNTFVKVVNQHFFNNPRFLYDVQQSFADEKANGTLDQSLRSLSLLTKNPDLISSVLGLLDSSDPALRSKALGVLQALGSQLNADSAHGMISVGMDFTGARSFSELQKQLRQGGSGTQSLSALVDEYYRFLQASETPGSPSLLNEISRDLGTGDLYGAIDQTLGTTPEQIAANVPLLAAIFPTLTANDGEILNGIEALFSSLQGPIPCLRGTKEVPDPVLHMFSEIAATPPGGGGDYIRRTHLLTMVAMEPFCEYPRALQSDYSELVKLADSPAMIGVEHVIKATYPIRDSDGSRPLVNLYRDFFEDPKNTEDLPLLQELTARNAWSDILLLADVLQNPQRAQVAAAMAFLTEPSPYLQGESVKDALTDLAVAGGPGKLLAIADALKALVDKNSSFAYPVLDGLRSGLLSDDSHPVIGLLRDLLLDARNEPEFFETVFSFSRMPEFRNSLRLISTMASDGRLKEILADLIELMRSSAQQGAHPIVAATVVPFKAERRHDLVSKNLGPAPSQVRLASSDPCASLAPNASISDPSDPSEFQGQWNRFLDCLTADGRYEDVKSSIQYLETEKTDSGQSELGLGIGLVQDLGHDLGRDEIDYLGDLWVRSEDGGELNHFLDLSSFWIAKRVIRPLLDLAKPLVEESQEKLHVLETFLANTLRADDFPQLVEELDRVSSLKLDPPLTALPVDYDLEQVKRWIGNNECENIPDDADQESWLKARENEIVRAYSQGVISFRGPGGAVLTSRSLGEIKELVEPVLQKFADPSASRPDHTLVDAIVNFLGYFSLQPGQQPNARQHYTPAYLAKFFYDRANDKTLITQYDLGDPPEAHPHVVYADSLDRLEAVVLNADFDFEIPGLRKLGIHAGMNLGKKALAEIGDSWGDEPRAMWPEQIRLKYRNRQPPTLRQTIVHLGKLLNLLRRMIGYPRLPDCIQQSLPRCRFGCIDLPDTSVLDLRLIKRHLYNLSQVYHVLLENLPGSGTPYHGGMRVLRDLFFQLNYSTPKKYQHQLSDDKNNLSFISFIARTGVDRQLAFDLRRFQPDSPVVNDFFGGLVSLSQAPAARKLIKELLVDDPQHQLIWSFAKGLDPLLGNPLSENGPRLDALRARQSLWYGLAYLEQSGLIAPATDALASLLDGNEGYFASHAESFAGSLSSLETSRLLRALYETPPSAGKAALIRFLGSVLSKPDLLPDMLTLLRSIEEDPAAQLAITEFEHRAAELDSASVVSPAEKQLLVRQALDALEDQSQDPRAQETARAIRGFVADHLESGDFDQILLLIARDPRKFEGLLDTAGKYVQNGDLKSFFAYVRRMMNPVN